MNKFPRKRNYAFLIEGYLEIKEPGYYYFFIETGINSRLFLGGKKLIDYASSSKHVPYQSYIVPLEKGFYPLHLEFLQKRAGNAPDFKYQIPDSNGINKGGAISIPLELQYSKM